MTKIVARVQYRYAPRPIDWRFTVDNVHFRAWWGSDRADELFSKQPCQTNETDGSREHEYSECDYVWCCTYELQRQGPGCY